MLSSYIKPMNIGFEMGALLLEGVELGLAGVTGPSRQRIISTVLDFRVVV